MTLLPRVSKTHPSMFFVLSALILHHLWMGLTQAAWPERYDNPSLSEVYRYIDRPTWVVGHLVVFGLVVVGAHVRWSLVQVGLGLGLLMAACRTWLVELGDMSGAGFGVWMVIIALHIGILMEPPLNPITAREL